MILPVSLAVAAACAIINIWLAVRVTRRRMTGKIMMGDGGDALMLSRGRAHANFVEYAPFALALIVLIEIAGGEPLWLWVIGALFVAARIAHPIGMDLPAPNPFRAGGTALTWIVLALLAGWALAIAYQAAVPVHAAPTETAPASV